MWRNVICTMGSEMRDGVRELIGQGRMAYMTSATQIVEGTPLANGSKVLVDADEGELAGARALLVSRVRAVVPAAEDLQSLRRIEEALLEAGLSALVVADLDTHVRKSFDKAVRTYAARPPDAVRDLLERMGKHELRFPMTWWHDDPDPGIDEMQERLTALGIADELPRAAIQEDHARRLDAAPPTAQDMDHEATVRRHVCGLLARAANEALERAGRSERWCPFADELGEDEDPLWLLLEPAAARVLRTRGILRAPAEPEASYAPWP